VDDARPVGRALLDLQRDLPTTAQDVEALRQLRPGGPIGFHAYLAFLASLPPATAAALRTRPGPARGSPFELPP
jgi:hypothetical protein